VVGPVTGLRHGRFNHGKFEWVDDADFVRADLGSHPMYLMSADGVNSFFSCNNSSLTSSFVLSIHLVRVLCAMLSYIEPG
jgi:hypothetical protein